MSNTEEYRKKVKASATVAVLEVLRRLGITPLQTLLSEVKKKIGSLADDQIPCKVKGHDHPEWEHQTDWALQDLKKDGVVNNYERGVWSLRPGRR